MKKNSANKILSFTVHDKCTLMDFLLACFPGKSRNSVRDIAKQKRISVKGQTVIAVNSILESGDVVAVLPLTGAGTVVGNIRIMYEDDDLIVIDKPPGMLCVGTEKEKENTAYSRLNAYIKRKDKNGRIFLLHRLDRDTSGVMLFAKKRGAQEKLQESWDEAVTGRIYAAVVEGNVPDDEGVIRSYLTEDKNFNVHSSPFDNGGKKAVTHYKTIKRGGGYSLLELSLETGRKNQIRVHMQSIGHSIAGDIKYGGNKSAVGRLALHAKSIAFIHPSSGEEMSFDSDIPGSFLRIFA